MCGILKNARYIVVWREDHWCIFSPEPSTWNILFFPSSLVVLLLSTAEPSCFVSTIVLVVVK